MVQIISITEARNNFASLIRKIKDTNTPVVIVQDSSPSVIIYPYEEIDTRVEKKTVEFNAQFQELLKEGKELFKEYSKKKNIKEPLTDDDAYSIIKNG